MTAAEAVALAQQPTPDDTTPRRVAATLFDSARRGAYQTTLAGTQDALVAQLSADGTTLGWLSYLGGGSTEEATGIGVDASQNVYVTGSTASQSPTAFPTSHAIQSSYGGGAHDAFVAAFNAGGASLAWSTYLGGSGDDTAAGLALDLDKNTFVVGSTISANFPVQAALQSSVGGGSSDVFFAELSPLPPPLVGALSSDTGSSPSDGITTGLTQSLSGTSLAGATLTFYQDGVGLIGTATADGAGNWTSPSTTLAEGSYAFTATQDGKRKVPGTDKISYLRY